ncbi:MAG: nucleotidyl transferase AbiEii/AbiGii toxin family protein [Ignavibacterium sp.]|uniref:nucleotidyl transferase AbiEii/AbiGii toxin family protein n=1 Tax=Ignavibacterium sp. TaxID=2651167 RepID=UPI00404A394D
MLSLKQIEKFYTDKEKLLKKNILREYLQYKILEIIFNHTLSNKLSFMGGTCLRIVYGTSRFSEDLDFDNFNLTLAEFEELSKIVKNELQLEGYVTEIQVVSKKAFRCYVRIPKLLFINDMSAFKDEKILIQIDTESQGFNYEPELQLINKFDIFTKIQITPKDILLSQKIWTILNRKVLKGRDLYDVTFLYSFAKPNFEYLKLKAGIANVKQLKEALNYRLKNLNLKKTADDVQPFLINPNDMKRILEFKEFIKAIS